MEIEFKIGDCIHAGGLFQYRHFSDGHEEGSVFISNPLCNYCNSPRKITEEDYITILVHEYVELECARICFHEGHRTWNERGFNKVYWGTFKSFGEF